MKIPFTESGRQMDIQFPFHSPLLWMPDEEANAL